MPAILQGKDVLARAKTGQRPRFSKQRQLIASVCFVYSRLSIFDCLTSASSAGTGKTLAFLVPSVENLFNRPPAPRSISVLVIAPTRELAFQISAEAEKLLRFHRYVFTRCLVPLLLNA